MSNSTNATLRSTGAATLIVELFFHFAALPSAFWLSALRHKNEDHPETTHVCNRRAVFYSRCLLTSECMYIQQVISISS